jgi:hypothetical protein
MTDPLVWVVVTMRKTPWVAEMSKGNNGVEIPMPTFPLGITFSRSGWALTVKFKKSIKEHNVCVILNGSGRICINFMVSLFYFMMMIGRFSNDRISGFESLLKSKAHLTIRARLRILNSSQEFFLCA